MLLKNVRLLTRGNVGNWKTKSGDILIDGDKITAVGTFDDDVSSHEVADGKGMLAAPGLVNGHQHTPMSLLRCYSDDVPLMKWLNEKMLPIEMKMDDEDRYIGALLSMAEMMKSGTTAYADMYIGMDQVAEAVTSSGIRASLARGLIAMDSNFEGRLREAADVVDRWHGKADGRITTMIAPHSPYMCPPELLKGAVALAGEKGVPLHIHLAETKDEERIIHDRYGMRPVQYLFENGVFEQHVLLAHGVHFNDEDFKILKGIKGGIVHNPVSNAKLGCGISDVKKLSDLGVKVGLGTDGAGSASTLDLFMEMKAASWMQKLRYEDAGVLSAHDVLSMATVNGADILGLGGVTGELKPGMKADVILLNMNQLHLTPAYEEASLLVYAASGHDVDTTVINGKMVMRGRELLTVDEEKLMFDARNRAEGLLKRLS
ncbi:amidohydrolase [Fictibacillus aquaticus]|uniref:5-methylthioadenosine/S-adenosylhomocysteine deaminase n=1 Tax=Fictibacillus aquaticus TaxID=2021314 RepID=A0A235F8S7_9BACL|nr:amidohydrolase [Fictibacillus aquaticus]OYD57387.1 N-ethylammeline chlorohydrolase [Fictibacillus aquaticus]